MVLKIVNADKSHSREIWEWRNNSITRSVSRKTDQVEWNNHEVWFKNSLESNRVFLYVGINKKFEKNVPIGVIRFNQMNISQNHYEVSINIAPHARKKGFGYYLLRDGTKKFIEEIDKCNRIYALVKVNNIPSIKLFTSAGYSLCDIGNDGFAKYFLDF